jgi:pimeloyl-ACP methyl ester carboxylesterase
LKVTQFDVLGISSGAPYSYAIGYKFPDRVRNIYILSGIPALYDEDVQAYWPYALNKNATMAELEELARELFFSNLSEEALKRNDIHDSMMNNCFGLAQDLKLRGLDWGFSLSDVAAPVYMQHSRLDEGVPFETAVMTSKLLPRCKLEVKEKGEHFSSAVLDDFIETVISGHYRRREIKARLEVGE